MRSFEIFSRRQFVLLLLLLFQPTKFTLLHKTPDLLALPSISNWDVLKAVKGLRPSKSVGLHENPASVMRGSSEIFISVLKFIFNLNKYFLLYGSKQLFIVPFFKVLEPLLTITDLYRFMEFFKIVMHYHVFYYFKYKLRAC
jgi:hypothetical protein